jgi:hypothetical protein
MNTPVDSPPDPPPPDPPIVNDTQWPNKPCHPLAIHDKYPPIGEPRPKPA